VRRTNFDSRSLQEGIPLEHLGKKRHPVGGSKEDATTPGIPLKELSLFG
jgi:hypothetical protein